MKPTRRISRARPRCVEVLRPDGREITVMAPAKLFFKRPQQPATKVAIRSTPLSDLYVVLAGIDDSGQTATFEVFLTPLVFWLWAGGLMMVLGTVIVMWPNVRERAAIATALSRSSTGARELADVGAPGVTEPCARKLALASSLVFLVVALFVFLSPELKNVSRETFAVGNSNQRAGFRGFDLPMRLRFDGRQLQYADLRLLSADAPRHRPHDRRGQDPRADNRLLSRISTARKFCPRRPPRASTFSRGRCRSSRSHSAAA